MKNLSLLLALIAIFSVSANAQYFDARDLKLKGPVKTVDISIYEVTKDINGNMKYEHTKDGRFRDVIAEEELNVQLNSLLKFNDRGQLVSLRYQELFDRETDKNGKRYPVDKRPPVYGYYNFEYSGDKLLKIVETNEFRQNEVHDIAFAYDDRNNLVTEFQVGASKFKNIYDDDNYLIQTLKFSPKGYIARERIGEGQSLFLDRLPAIIQKYLTNFDGVRIMNEQLHTANKYDVANSLELAPENINEAFGDLSEIPLDKYHYQYNDSGVLTSCADYNIEYIKDSHGNWTEMIFSQRETGEPLFAWKRLITYYDAYKSYPSKPYSIVKVATSDKLSFYEYASTINKEFKERYNSGPLFSEKSKYLYIVKEVLDAEGYIYWKLHPEVIIKELDKIAASWNYIFDQFYRITENPECKPYLKNISVDLPLPFDIYKPSDSIQVTSNGGDTTFEVPVDSLSNFINNMVIQIEKENNNYIEGFKKYLSSISGLEKRDYTQDKAKIKEELDQFQRYFITPGVKDKCLELLINNNDRMNEAWNAALKITPEISRSNFWDAYIGIN